MSPFSPAAAWRGACVSDPVLAAWAGEWSVCFAIESNGESATFDFAGGHARLHDGTPLFA